MREQSSLRPTGQEQVSRRLRGEDGEETGAIVGDEGGGRPLGESNAEHHSFIKK